MQCVYYWCEWGQTDGELSPRFWLLQRLWRGRSFVSYNWRWEPYGLFPCAGMSLSPNSVRECECYWNWGVAPAQLLCIWIWLQLSAILGQCSAHHPVKVISLSHNLPAKEVKLSEKPSAGEPFTPFCCSALYAPIWLIITWARRLCSSLGFQAPDPCLMLIGTGGLPAQLTQPNGQLELVWGRSEPHSECLVTQVSFEDIPRASHHVPWGMI